MTDLTLAEWALLTVPPFLAGATPPILIALCNSRKHKRVPATGSSDSDRES